MGLKIQKVLQHCFPKANTTRRRISLPQNQTEMCGDLCLLLHTPSWDAAWNHR